MKCPECSEELEIEESGMFHEVVCYRCGWFEHERFKSRESAEKYIYSTSIPFMSPT